jgi:hypothetical protein
VDFIEHYALRRGPQRTETKVFGNCISAAANQNTVRLSVPGVVSMVTGSDSRRGGLADLPWSGNQRHLAILLEVLAKE